MLKDRREGQPGVSPQLFAAMPKSHCVFAFALMRLGSGDLHGAPIGSDVSYRGSGGQPPPEVPVRHRLHPPHCAHNPQDAGRQKRRLVGRSLTLLLVRFS